MSCVIESDSTAYLVLLKGIVHHITLLNPPLVWYVYNLIKRGEGTFQKGFQFDKLQHQRGLRHYVIELLFYLKETSFMLGDWFKTYSKL